MNRSLISPGIHLVHKPVGPTSFSLVKSFIEDDQAAGPHRRTRICHGGTLDPFAHGLLLILAGPATRLFDHLHDVPKIYQATVSWGAETDNGDLLGRTTFNGDTSVLSAHLLDNALSTFVGWRDQTPPATSAKRIDGERAYLKAHRGENVVMPPVHVYLHEARWLSHDLPRQSTLLISVRGGYYVRALARDLGRLVGCGAHLTALHRTAIGPWTDPGPGNRVEIHGRDLLPWTTSRLLSDQEVGDLRRNHPIEMGPIEPPDWNLPPGFPQPPVGLVRGFHQQRFSFLLIPQDGQLRTLSALGSGL